MCPETSPKHLSVTINKWNYRLQYKNYFGGVSAISKGVFSDSFQSLFSHLHFWTYFLKSTLNPLLISILAIWPIWHQFSHFHFLTTIFNSRLKLSFGVVQDWWRNPIFQNEVNEPYPELNCGETIKRARGPVHTIRCINQSLFFQQIH